MAGQIARIRSRGRLTIPKAARAALGLESGDRVVVEVVAESLLVRRLVEATDPYLAGLEASLQEWNSLEDEAAFRDL